MPRKSSNGGQGIIRCFPAGFHAPAVGACAISKSLDCMPTARRTLLRICRMGGRPRTPHKPLVPLIPEAMRIGLGRLPDDGQRHFRHSPGGGDAAVDLAVGIVLAAVLDLK